MVGLGLQDRDGLTGVQMILFRMAEVRNSVAITMAKMTSRMRPTWSQ